MTSLMPLTPFHFLQAHPELRSPSPCSRHSKLDSDNEPDSPTRAGEGAGCQSPTPCSEERREAAVRTLQARWKAHRRKVSVLIHVQLQRISGVHAPRDPVCFAHLFSAFPHPHPSSHPLCVEWDACRREGCKRWHLERRGGTCL